MTVYQCSACDKTHDTSEPACPQTVLSVPLQAPGHVRAIWTTELERHVLAAALMARLGPSLSPWTQALYNRLLPTAAEREYGREFAAFMASATPEEREQRLAAETLRGTEEAVFIAALSEEGTET